MPERTYDFLLSTYETEILKTLGIWSAFPESAASYRPDEKSRTVLEHMEHQVESEERWMRVMLGIETGDPYPRERTRAAFAQKYSEDAQRRLEMLRSKPEEWWREHVEFFDVKRSRAWIMTRRIAHTAHHRGQLAVYLRLLQIPQPSVYGPTADTGGRVIYQFPPQARHA
jgi:uncharacterized damage-inducible protein DinB